MTIKLNGSTAGSVSLDAPASTTGNADIAFKLPVADGSANQVLKTDGSGNLGFVAQPAAGISVAQQFRLAADQYGSNTAGTVFTNWQNVMTTYTAIGSAWSQSNGIFSCSVTGIYLCHWTMVVRTTSTEDAYDPNIQISQDSGSTYVDRSRTWGKVDSNNLNQSDSPSASFMFDVDNTSTFRLRFRQSSGNSLANQTLIAGSTSENLTNIIFIRLGDT
jgi:hypothetical protein